MPKNVIKRQRGTVVETVYIKKTTPRGVKTVAKDKTRLSSRLGSSRTNRDFQSLAPIEVEVEEFLDQPVEVKMSTQGKVCHW
jgi:hypothetical protein